MVNTTGRRKGARLTVILAILAALFVTAGCRSASLLLSDQQASTYADYEAVQASGNMERGWIPERLPESASDIRLKYDIDTNEILLTFHFDPAEMDDLLAQCAPAELTATDLPQQLSASWWPGDLQGPDTAVSRYAFYGCDSAYLAIDSDQNQAFFWSLGDFGGGR
jgi:hypothetical protein